MRLVVSGRDGQVARALSEVGPAFGCEVVRVGRPQLDLTRCETVAAVVQALRPDVVISAAAYTAVDRAESEAPLAFATNAAGAGALAAAAAEIGAPILHLSTDYVFNGEKPAPYVETDRPDPLGIYGASKLAGEHAVAAAQPNHVILRTAWVYSQYGSNFLKTMLRIGQNSNVVRVVSDQRGNPTSAIDIANALLSVAHNVVRDHDPSLRGVFHLAAQGEATWADFAGAIFAGWQGRGGASVRVTPITTADYPTPAKRPRNSRLSCEKLARVHGIVLPHWKKSLAETLDCILVTPVSDVEKRGER